MSKRRGQGEGTIFRRISGRWVAQLDLGWTNGRRVRKSFTATTRLGVQHKLLAAAHLWREGKRPPTDSLTVEQFLREWLDRLEVAPLTRESYEQKVLQHIVPALGRLRLRELSPKSVEDLLRSKAEKLSPRSVFAVRAVLRTALSRAERWGYVDRNVASLAASPKVERYDATYLTVSEARSFLVAAKGDRLYAMYCLAMSLGLRQGELLGLQWKDVDLGTAAILVRQALKSIKGRGLVLMETKTPKSRRTLVLPEFVRTELRHHRAKQLEERLRAGSLWTDNDLVFTTEVGTPIDASNVLRRSFHRICAAASITYSTRTHRGLRFHDLRTSAATMMLAIGLPDRVVMETLGHSNLGMTAHYQHVPSSLLAEAAKAMDRALG